MKNANMPAMPCEVVEQYHINQVIAPDGSSMPTLRERKVMGVGMTKREMMAMHMMAAQIGAVSSWEAAEMLTDAIDERGIDRGYPEKLLAINAVEYADALLAQLERTK